MLYREPTLRAIPMLFISFWENEARCIVCFSIFATGSRHSPVFVQRRQKSSVFLYSLTGIPRGCRHFPIDILMRPAPPLLRPGSGPAQLNSDRLRPAQVCSPYLRELAQSRPEIINSSRCARKGPSPSGQGSQICDRYTLTTTTTDMNK
jgi:hypothetical protein